MDEDLDLRYDASFDEEPNLDEMEYDIDAIAIEILPKDNISKEYCEVYSSLIHNKI